MYIYEYIPMKVNWMIAQKTPKKKKTAMLNAVTLIFTYDGTSSETQADLKTEGKVQGCSTLLLKLQL